MTNSTIIVITGQTATGKTRRALDLAKEVNGELISADSRQVYKNLDIVTGKDRAELERSGEQVHGIDLVSPEQEFSSHDFVQAASAAIPKIQSQGHTPIIVGGSWLYIKHLLYGHTIQAPPNAALRESLNNKTVQELQIILAELENTNTPTLVPGLKSLNHSDSQNPHRIIRRIEILTHYAQKPADEPIISPQFSRLNPHDQAVVQIDGYRFGSRLALQSAIQSRVHKRLEQGALEEVKTLLHTYSVDAPGLQTIGYTQLIAHINGQCTLDQAIAEWTTRELQYAKRQYTFMKTDPTIRWHTLAD